MSRQEHDRRYARRRAVIRETGAVRMPIVPFTPEMLAEISFKTEILMKAADVKRERCYRPVYAQRAVYASVVCSRPVERSRCRAVRLYDRAAAPVAKASRNDYLIAAVHCKGTQT